MWRTQLTCKCGNKHALLYDKDEYVEVGEQLYYTCPQINERIPLINRSAWTQVSESVADEILAYKQQNSSEERFSGLHD